MDNLQYGHIWISPLYVHEYNKETVREALSLNYWAVGRVSSDGFKIAAERSPAVVCQWKSPRIPTQTWKISWTAEFNSKYRKSYLPAASSCMETGTGGLSVSLWGANWGEGERCPSMVGWVGPAVCWVGRTAGGGGGGKGGGTSSCCSSSSPIGPLLCSNPFQGTGAETEAELWLLTEESEAKTPPCDPGWTSWKLLRGGGVPSGHLYFSRWGKRTELLFLERADGSLWVLWSEKCSAGLWWLDGGSKVFFSRSSVKAEGGASGFSLHKSSLYPFSLNLRKQKRNTLK